MSERKAKKVLTTTTLPVRSTTLVSYTTLSQLNLDNNSENNHENNHENENGAARVPPSHRATSTVSWSAEEPSVIVLEDSDNQHFSEQQDKEQQDEHEQEQQEQEHSNQESDMDNSFSKNYSLAANLIKKTAKKTTKNIKNLAPAKNIKNFATTAVTPLQSLTQEIGTIGGQATAKIKNIKHVKNIKHAAYVIADFIPVVGNTYGASNNSRRSRFSRMESSRHHILGGGIDTDELDQHPLHKACALSTSLTIIQDLVEQDPEQLNQQLPTSGDTPLHIAVRFGAIQWHQMQNYPHAEGTTASTATSNLSIIEYLIRADIDHKRKKTLLERKKQGTNSPISLASLISESALYQQDSVVGNLPIHIAAEEGYEDALVALLKVDKDANYESILMANTEDGNLPLHLAVLRDDLKLVDLLLVANKQRQDMLKIADNNNNNIRNIKNNKSKAATLSCLESLLKPNKEGDLPLHLALSSPLEFDIWKLLLDPDKTKATLHIANEEGVTPFRFFVDQPHLCENEDQFVDAHLAEAILNRLLSGKRLEPWDDQLKRSVARSHKMQLMMNEKATSRLPVCIFMADFYAHMLSIATLYLATDSILESQDGALHLSWVDDALFVLTAYFAAREFIQLLLSKNLYWSDVWNYTDLVRIACLIILALVAQGQLLDPTNENHVYFGRRMLLASAVFVYLGVISFLRMTYLPFALFVGGSSQVVITLIPFMVTFVLAMGLFAYGYWVGGFLVFDGASGDYTDWLLSIFLLALADPIALIDLEEGFIDKTVWTILYAILVQVLLLNVLIAVITSAWEEITLLQTEVFWKYRLEYAAGILPIENFLRKRLRGSCMLQSVDRAAKLFDSLDEVQIRDSVPDWKAYPYSKVLEDPSLYWDQKLWQSWLAEKTTRTQAPSWFQPESASAEQGELSGHNALSPTTLVARENIRSFQADVKFSTSFGARMWTRLRFLGYLYSWLIALAAGFVTLGFTWPQSMRTFFCAPSTTSSDDSKDNGARESDLSSPSSGDVDSAGLMKSQECLEKKIDHMKETMEALQRTLEHLVKLQSTTGDANDN